MGCEGYNALAAVYDHLNRDVDYEAWADFLEACFAKMLPAKPELVLDLACGTGRMTRVLAQRGYDMIGVDGSGEMLAEAYAQGTENGEKSILYLCQDMRNLELYGTVGAVVCCLDSINYLLREEDIRKVFSLVHNYLDPGGLFLFDVNTPYKFQTIYGNQAYLLEEETDGRAIWCGWQNEYDEATGLCDFYLTLFRETENGMYLREEEHQQERRYDRDTLVGALTDCGFEIIGIYADYHGSQPTPTTERWYFAARAVKS